MVCNDELLFTIVLAFQNKFTFFFIKPELPWCCNDEDEKFVYICYLCSLLVFFTVKVRVYLPIKCLQCVVLLTKNQTCFTGYNLKSYELYEISSCSKCLHRSNVYNTHRSVIKMVYFLLQQLCEYTNKMVQSCSQINILT